MLGLNQCLALLVFVAFPLKVLLLDNGVELTPAMGFMDWERFRCNTDCKQFPDDCISEWLFKSIADAMVSSGLRDAGYEYVSIDDCWMARERTADGQLQPDPERFPSGMKNLADYMHDRSLKLGIYEDFGTNTCAGYPGSQGHEKTDAETFAAWGVDMLKFDGCYSNNSAKPEGYINMARELNQTGRPILYACSWPAYVPNPNYTVIELTCNQWRNQGDIQDCWSSVISIINAYAENQDEYAKYHGPGHFNDPDEIIIGDNGLSFGQQKIQMAVWSLWSAPLLISADLRKINNDSLQLLLNKNLIKIDQDPVGNFAKQVITRNSNREQIWVKTLSDPNFGVNAICYFNARTDDQTVIFRYSLQQLGVAEPPAGYNFALMDVFTSTIINKFPLTWTTVFDIRVEAFDTTTVVVMLVQDQSHSNLDVAAVKDTTDKFETRKKI